MNRIKFHSEYDLDSGLSIKNIVEFINTFENEKNIDINDILEYFNIIKFSMIEKYSEIINIETSYKFNNELNILNNSIVQFIGKYKCTFLNLYKNVDFEYREDFWELVDKYNIYKNFDEIELEKLLNQEDFHYFIILKYRKIVNYFDEILQQQMLNDIKCAEILLDKYAHKGTNGYEIFLPKSLSEKDKNYIVANYIESDIVRVNYLENIVQFPSNTELKIEDKMRLKAKRRYEEEVRKLSGVRISTEIGAKIEYSEDQVDDVIYSNKDMKFKCSVSLRWIKENLDFNTLLNNFIYIFEFFDMQMRLNLVSKESEISVFENIFRIKKFKHLYKESSVFEYKDMISTSQIDSYISILQKYNIRLESIIEWFFNSYLLDEFNINGYIVKMPTKSSSYFEKCRSILPEIDSILKQYKIYLEDGEIDQELLQISSSHIFFKDCISSINNKYVYPSSDLFNRASNLLFSDQSPICHLPDIGNKYSNFYQLVKNDRITLRSFEKYQVKLIEWLIEKQFIYINESGYLEFVNEYRICIFSDLYKNNVINYWHCDHVLRKEIDNLISENILKIDNKLFTNDEQDYLDYHLNKSKFSNSLDLRNSYLHGTQTNDDNLHKMNYVRILKLIIIIITKINDDLCIKDIKNSNK